MRLLGGWTRSIDRSAMELKLFNNVTNCLVRSDKGSLPTIIFLEPEKLNTKTTYSIPTATTRSQTSYFDPCCLFAMNEAHAAEAIKQAQISAKTYQGKVIAFSGEITHESVEKFIRENHDTDAQLLHLASQVGSATAAIRIGNWIIDKSSDVRIVACFSACANGNHPFFHCH